MARKKVENNIEEPNEAPKKRGRKPKYNKDLYTEYPDYIKNIVVPAIENNKDKITRIFGKEEEITKEEWNEAKDLVQYMLHDLYNFNTFYFKPFPDNISKKAPSQIRGLDRYHEKDSKAIIMNYLTQDIIDEPGKAFMVFLHIKKYVFESSKECKL